MGRAPAAGLFALAYLLFPVFSPPLSPTLTPEQVGAFFADNVTGILGVTILCNLIACSLVPLFAVTAVQISRTATSSSVFTYAYLLCVGVGLTAFILADYCWAMAAFRPERDPQLISLLNDMAWFFFIAPVGTIIVQNFCLALSIYLDARPDPVFPRWVAHFNVAAAVLLVPSAFAAVQDRAARLGRFALIHAAAQCLRRLSRGHVRRAARCGESPGRRA